MKKGKLFKDKLESVQSSMEFTKVFQISLSINLNYQIYRKVLSKIFHCILFWELKLCLI